MSRKHSSASIGSQSGSSSLGKSCTACKSKTLSLALLFVIFKYFQILTAGPCAILDGVPLYEGIAFYLVFFAASNPSSSAL